MIRIHTDNFVPRYSDGKWIWDEDNDELQFKKYPQEIRIEECLIRTFGYKFRRELDAVDEVLFREKYQRTDSTYDNDVITLQDVKNLVLYLAPSAMLTEKFLHLLHTTTINNLLQGLLIYFELFLKLVEFLLIRRDELEGPHALLQTQHTVRIKRVYSNHLRQYRLLIAREYSKVLLGTNGMKPYYHFVAVGKISKTIVDRKLHEQLLSFCTQVVWIAMHRRAHDIIEMEMSRLFRSEHFMIVNSPKLKLSRAEENLLYGINYRRVNYRAQNSPIVQELQHVSTEDLPILALGMHKYRGTDKRLMEMELEYLVPDSQLLLIGVTRGILGHPKKLYNTMLNIDWNAVRREQFNEKYDPYNIVRQPYLKIPDIDDDVLRHQAQHFDSYYRIKCLPIGISSQKLQDWLRRDRSIHYNRTRDALRDIWERCSVEVTSEKYRPSVEEIIEKFGEKVKKFRKKIS